MKNGGVVSHLEYHSGYAVYRYVLEPRATHKKQILYRFQHLGNSLIANSFDVLYRVPEESKTSHTLAFLGGGSVPRGWYKKTSHTPPVPPYQGTNIREIDHSISQKDFPIFPIQQLLQRIHCQPYYPAIAQESLILTCI